MAGECVEGLKRFQVKVKFSIVIPVYNVASYLRECLDSVLAQTFTDWEAICVDDGSTDGSGSILDEYAVRDGRFRIIHQKNAGVSAARNAALDVAQGEWIWFVDADDMIHPRALGFLAEEEKGYSALELIAFEGYVRGESLAAWPELKISNRIVGTDKGWSRYRYIRHGAWNVIFRRKPFGDMRLEHYAIGEDFLFFGQMYWRMKRFETVDVPLYFYRQRATGASGGNVSFGAVHDNLEIEYRNLLLIKEYREQWTGKDFQGFFERYWRYFILTYKDKFLRISDADRRRCIPIWIKLQSLALDMGEKRRYLRLVTCLLRIIPSGKVASLSVRFILAYSDLPVWCVPFRIGRAVFKRMIPR